jgi:hypothetical protein
MNRFRAIAILPLLFISMAVLSSCVSSSVPQPGAPSITTTTIPGSAVVGVPYVGATISTSGGTTPLSYSLSSGSLPNGLALARDGVISGTAKTGTNGTYTFVVEVTDSHNPPRTALSPTFTITVTSPTPPVIQCPFALSGGVCPLGTYPLGQTLNIQFTTSAGTGPFTWNTLTSPPFNLALGRTTGLFSGQAAQANNGNIQSFTISVTDVAGETSPTLTCTITITPGSTLSITGPGTLPAGVVGTKYGSGGNGVQFTASGGLAPYIWSPAGTIPTGLSITSTGATTAVLSGTPTMAQSAPYSFQVEVQDSQNPPMTAFSPPGSEYNVTITSTITVAITNPITTIQIGAAPVTLNATVTNDASPGNGVTWKLQSGSPLADCTSNGCGTITPIGSPSFSATYTPPAAVGAAPNNTPTITAVAFDDPSKTATDPFTIKSNITVTITNPITMIDANAAPVTLNATVTGDTAPGGGVNWTLQSGSPLTSCAGPGTNNCGTLKALGTPSFSATYTPPTTQPTGANDTPTITATAADDPTKSDADMFTINAPGAACGTGRESEMTGSFAYLMKGFDANGAVAVAGSVHADGTGKITEGVEDINRAGTGPQTNVPIVPGGSSYTLGADGRGCMTVATTTGPTTFRFSLDAFNSGAPTRGNIIEFDDNTGNGTRGAGIIRAQDPTSFANSKFANSYAFGLSGFGSSGEHVAVAGTLASDGKGNVTGGNFDRNDAGNLTAKSSKLVGTYSIPSGSTTGRGTMGATLNGTAFAFAVYMVSSNEAILAGVDPISETNQLTSGEAIASVGPFSNTTLAGSHLLRTNALNRSGSNAGSRATIGALTFDGNAAGGVTGTLFDDEAGRNSTTTILHGAATYAVDSSTGRITFTGVGTDSPVGYAVQSGSGITAFLVGTDDGAADGALEFQTKGSANFKSSTFTGAFSFGTDENLDYATTNESHAASVDSKATTVAGASDASQPRANGLLPNQSFSNAFVFNSAGIGTVGTDPAVTNGTVIFFINEDGGNTHPRITVAEKQ